jgi:MFS family permease
MPAVTIAPTWYGPRRGLAMGIILAGTGVGGLIWAPAITAMNKSLGFRRFSEDIRGYFRKSDHDGFDSTRLGSYYQSPLCS